MELKWKRVGANYESKCGRFIIRHTGTQGRSTRMFTAFRKDNGTQIGNSGGLNYCKKNVEMAN